MFAVPKMSEIFTREDGRDEVGSSARSRSDLETTVGLQWRLVMAIVATSGDGS